MDNRYFGMPKGSKDVASGIGSHLKDFGGQVTWDSKLYNTQANRHIKRDRYMKENSDISDLLKINKDYYSRQDRSGLRLKSMNTLSPAAKPIVREVVNPDFASVRQPS